jgi:hypothetical protein
MNTDVLDIRIGDEALALKLPKDQTFEEWMELGRNLAAANKTLNWWIGDWWAAGTHRYGARAQAAAEGIFGREFQSLMDMASVCRAFPTSRRREALSFTHHREVASLPPAKADALLDKAERDNWSVRDIRAEANAIRNAANKASSSTGPIDPEEIEWSCLVAAWNRARVAVRERFLEAREGTSAIFDG